MCHDFYEIPVIFFLYQQPVLLDAGEDDASIEQHLAVMAAEIDRADRVHPSAEILLDRQKRTLAARTEDLQNLTTIEILVKYPWINMPKLVCITFAHYC